MKCNFTIYPEIRETKITKYYKNVIIFDGEKINFINITEVIPTLTIAATK